jgi:GTP-binding protein
MPIVAIVGRPNVGKSALFNRLIGQRKAIVDDLEGVTRDRIYGKSDWNGREFTVIDTGGYVHGSDDVFEKEIRDQVELALDQADAILFVVDSQTGITPLDEEVAKLLRKTKKPVILVVNKVDNTKRLDDVWEFYNLGFERVFPVSAINGSGTGELLDELVSLLPEEEQEEKQEDVPVLTVAGRPNVGKSTFINTLFDEKRNVVSDIAGTTRDTVRWRYNKFDRQFDIIDTAGMRKKKNIDEDVEYYSVLRSIKAIENADVVLLMLDATQGMEAQDLKIFDIARRNNKGIVILVNKWDKIDKDTHTAKEYTERIKERIAPFTDVPVVFMSALNKQRILKAIDEALEVARNRRRKIKTSELNATLLPIIKDNPPPATKGKHVKIKYITQLPTYTPKFAFFANLPQYIKEPYKRFLENQIRKHWNFKGVPIEIYFRQK